MQIKMKTKLRPTGQVLKYKNEFDDVKKYQVKELVNPRRRFITKICNQLGITRKKFKKRNRGNSEFQKEVSELWEQYKIDNNLQRW